MTMSARSSAALRDNARLFGVIFETLAVLSFFGTLIATEKVANLGSQLGIGAVNDPASWFVFVGGLFASLMLAGIGFALGILCAIYDRQELTSKELGILAMQSVATETSRYQNQEVMNPVGHREKPAPTPAAAKIVPPPPPIIKPVTPSTSADIPDNDSMAQKSILWDWLTRERHIFRSSDD
jgi:hypothetical protein